MDSLGASSWTNWSVDMSFLNRTALQNLLFDGSSASLELTIALIETLSINHVRRQRIKLAFLEYLTGNQRFVESLLT